MLVNNEGFTLSRRRRLGALTTKGHTHAHKFLPPPIDRPPLKPKHRHVVRGSNIGRVYEFWWLWNGGG